MYRWLIAIGLVGSVVVSAPVRSAFAGPAETKEIAAVIDQQFAAFRDPTGAPSVYAKDAMVAMTGGTSSPQVDKLDNAAARWSIFGPAQVGKHKLRDLRVVVARDGQSAWASFGAQVSVDGLEKTGTVDYRATELFARVSTGWQVKGAAWSVGIAKPRFAKAVKQGQLAALESVYDQNVGDADVLAAVQALATAGLDPTAAARTDIVGIGRAVGDVISGGKKLAAKLKTEWGDKLTVEGSTWAVTVGTTACATVNIRLAGGPARLFAVFEKTEAGTWSPVLVHVGAAVR